MLRICRRQSGQQSTEGGKRLKQDESGENILKRIFSTFSCSILPYAAVCLTLYWRSVFSTVSIITYQRCVCILFENCF